MTKPSVALKQYPSNIGLDSDVDFLRSLLERGLKGVQLVISDAHEGLKTAISQVLTGATWQRCRVHFLCTTWPEAAKLLEEAEDDILTFVAFPKKHWIRIYSTNPLERLNKEVKRSTNVVGVFPGAGRNER